MRDWLDRGVLVCVCVRSGQEDRQVPYGHWFAERQMQDLGRETMVSLSHWREAGGMENIGSI